jgi:transposase InsO family protein
VHVDIKKLGRIPDGGGHRRLGRQVGTRNNGRHGRGYAYLHHAVDDHSRLAYSEILGDERGETAAAFWERARAFFAEVGVIVDAVLTDNGACYRSHVFARALGKAKHRRTRPYRPQTNGKVERFNRTLAAEWADARTYSSDEARAATYGTGSVTSIITDPTPASVAPSPQTAFTTSWGSTTSRSSAGSGGLGEGVLDGGP